MDLGTMPGLPRPDVTSGLAMTVKRYNPLLFLRQVRQELKKVEWPTREKTVKLTILVIAASVAVGAYIGGLDAVFTYLLTYLVQ